MSKYDWKKTDDRRVAAMQFLQAVSQDTDESRQLRKTVLSDRAAAARLFAEIGEIDCPPDVEFICLPNNTVDRDKLVVFALPDRAIEVPTPESAFNFWLAAWGPY